MGPDGVDRLSGGAAVFVAAANRQRATTGSPYTFSTAAHGGKGP
jgi:hypothetical protein